MNAPDARELRDEEPITQYGSASSRAQNPHFRHCPRVPKDRGGISVIVGRLDSHAAAELVRTRDSTNPDEDLARHTTVGRLRAAGFRVEHAPSRKNPGHTRVCHDSAPDGVWAPDVQELFDLCFDEEAEGSGDV
jgi:hypothetical protein